MARHRRPPPPPAHGKEAVGQWILLILFGVLAVLSAVFFVSGVVLTVQHGFSRYWFVMALGSAFCVAFTILARNRIYRLRGKDVPEGSGGGLYL